MSFYIWMFNSNCCFCSFTKKSFGTYLPRIGAKINWDEELKTDHSRAKLSDDPNNLFLRHPNGESVEDYQTEISTTKWNDPRQEVRADKNFVLSVDASINPLKGLLKN